MRRASAGNTCSRRDCHDARECRRDALLGQRQPDACSARLAPWLRTSVSPAERPHVSSRCHSDNHLPSAARRISDGCRIPFALFDLFRQGEVDAEIRILAARAVGWERTSNWLCGLARRRRRPDVRATVSTTIARIPASRCPRFWQADVSPALREFFASTRPSPPRHRTPSRQSRSRTPGDGGCGRAAGRGAPEGARRGGTVPSRSGWRTRIRRAAGGRQIGRRRSSRERRRRVARYRPTDRQDGGRRPGQAGHAGTREERAVLIRDPNKMVASRFSQPETQRKRGRSDLTNDQRVGRRAAYDRDSRHGSNTTAWCWPGEEPEDAVGISMSLVKRLAERDLKSLSTDRNIRGAALSARKLLVNAEARR